jgi:hypothetical protein
VSNPGSAMDALDPPPEVAAHPWPLAVLLI